MASRRQILATPAALAVALSGCPATLPFTRAAQASSSKGLTAQKVLQNWFGLTLELVRHTATYTPPVASRAFAYLAITAFEAMAGLSNRLVSLEGQLHGLAGVPRPVDRKHHAAVVMHAALEPAVAAFFANTGPTGQRAIAALKRKLDAALPMQANPKSAAHGIAVARHIIAWSAADGGAVVTNMGFPESYTPAKGLGHWVPTTAIRLQQAPLLPGWGDNRTFALPQAATCALPPPPDYSEDKASPFYREALEVYETTRKLSPEQKLIARFWSDDPMLSPTPPGHWFFLTLDILKSRNASLEDTVDVLARLGIAVADGFIACWNDKFRHDLLRPVTYIKKVIDKTWEPLLITPPFPEYPSGHSTQSGAAEAVLTAFFGEDFAFEDKTHVREKLAPRKYASFRAAAAEAGISRLYGGIHFRSAVERGLEQGRCVGAHAVKLKTRVLT